MAYKFNPHTGALDYYKDFTADEGHDLTLHQNLGLVSEPITYTIAPSGPGDTGGSYTDPYIFGTNGEQVLYVGTNNGNTFVQIDDIANGTYKIFDDSALLPMVPGPEDVYVVVAGGAGKHSSVVPNCTFSRAVSRVIDRLP